MNPYSVSVVIPTYNRAGLLTRAIDSVQRQTRPAMEIIVVDDGSNDDTGEILRSAYHNIQYEFISHGGVSKARNVGIELSRGDWIAFLDSDDEWSPLKLQLQIEALQQQPSYRLCHTDEYWIRDGRRVNPMQKHQKRGGNIYKHCLPLCAISPSTVMIHRSIFEHIGVFDTTLPACEDYDLWLRICAQYPALFLEQKLVTRYAGHADQLSNLHWGMDRFRIAALVKMLENSHLATENRQLTLETLQQKCAILINGGKKRGNQELVDYYQQIAREYS